MKRVAAALAFLVAASPLCPAWAQETAGETVQEPAKDSAPATAETAPETAKDSAAAATSPAPAPAKEAAPAAATASTQQQPKDPPKGSAQDVIAPHSEADASPSLDTTRDFYVEVNGGKFRPAVDGQAGLTGRPYTEIFGRHQMWVFGTEFDYELWRGFGTVAAGLAADYAVVWGHGIVAKNGNTASDATSLNTVPLRLLAVYRFDLLARRWGIPLVPFGKAGLAYTFWWITNGSGSVAQLGDTKARGGKWGYELAVGLALELNFIDPWLSREMDQEFGINSVALQAQYMRISADNFGKNALAMDLSANTWMFGLGFEF